MVAGEGTRAALRVGGILNWFVVEESTSESKLNRLTVKSIVWTS